MGKYVNRYKKKASIKHNLKENYNNFVINK